MEQRRYGNYFKLFVTILIRHRLRYPAKWNLFLRGELGEIIIGYIVYGVSLLFSVVDTLMLIMSEQVPMKISPIILIKVI